MSGESSSGVTTGSMYYIRDESNRKWKLVDYMPNDCIPVSVGDPITFLNIKKQNDANNDFANVPAIIGELESLTAIIEDDLPFNLESQRNVINDDEVLVDNVFLDQPPILTQGAKDHVCNAFIASTIKALIELDIESVFVKVADKIKSFDKLAIRVEVGCETALRWISKNFSNLTEEQLQSDMNKDLSERMKLYTSKYPDDPHYTYLLQVLEKELVPKYKVCIEILHDILSVCCFQPLLYY